MNASLCVGRTSQGPAVQTSLAPCRAPVYERHNDIGTIGNQRVNAPGQQTSRIRLRRRPSTPARQAPRRARLRRICATRRGSGPTILAPDTPHNPCASPASGTTIGKAPIGPLRVPHWSPDGARGAAPPAALVTRTIRGTLDRWRPPAGRHSQQPAPDPGR